MKHKIAPWDVLRLSDGITITRENRKGVDMDLENVLWKELRDGRKVEAKMYKGEASAKTYANLTQAKKAAARLGRRWYVTGHRPFYVTYGSKL